MKKLFAACCIVFCLVQVLPAETAWAQKVSGRVFLDKNGNGKLDRGEPGIAKVPVTDGVQFVLSDAKGAYTIDVADDPVLKEGGVAIISISRPSNYRPTTPWFRRVVEMAKQGGADFGLKHEKQSLPFVFIHLTDTHMPRWPGKFARFRGDIQKDVRFCVITGDLVNNADGGGFEEVKGQFDTFRKQTRDFPVPLYFVSGNHDIAGVRAKWEDRQKKNPLYAYAFYTRHVGPLPWSVNHAGIP
ncbi:MAG: metallophosphoesterase, partial [Planctomycetia bacterium]|nr:metallophosphoesterase [Planctomycetia bacterium]